MPQMDFQNAAMLAFQNASMPMPQSDFQMAFGQARHYDTTHRWTDEQVRTQTEWCTPAETQL